MPIDPRIALGVQPLQVADPMARYSQMAGIQNAQNQNALAQYQLSAAQRADEQQNKLYAAAQQPDFKLDFQSAIQYGAPGMAAYKAQQEASNAQTEGQIKSTKLLTDKLSLLPEAYKRADTPEAYLALHQSIHADPVLGPYLKSVGATPEKGMAQIQNAIQTGNFEKLRMGSMQSVSQILDSLKPMAVAASSSVYDPQTGTFKQAPAAPVAPKETDLQLNYKAAKDQGFVGTIFDYEKKLKEAGRAPAQPRAEQPLVAVKGPGGIPIYVTREEARQNRMSPPDASGGTSTEGERKAATLLQRLQFSQNQLTKALTDDPKAAGPEAFAAAVGKFSTTAGNLLNSQARQRVEAAQLDILDAALTLGTGAAYTREQLEGYRQAYFPAYGDEPQTILDKQARLQNVIEAAQIAAGKAGKLVPLQTPVAPVSSNSDVRNKADQILKRKP